jgi:hypothetical protein
MDTHFNLLALILLKGLIVSRLTSPKEGMNAEASLGSKSAFA